MEAIGGPAACEITWSVEVAIPECKGAKFAGFIMEYCYGLNIDIDRSGYSTRTYSGHVMIPQTRKTQSSRTLSDTADSYREKINPQPIPGFRRIQGPFGLSEDKCTLTFSITDEEMAPNIPPTGTVDAQASHTVASVNANLSSWTHTFNASYEMAKDQSRNAPFGMFMALVNDRIKASKANVTQKLKGGFIPTFFSCSEPEIYGRKCASFTAVFRFFTELQSIMNATGLWRPVPNSDWKLWSQSLASTAFNIRGWAGLTVSPSSDVIIDLCNPVKTGATIPVGGIAGKPPPAPGNLNLVVDVPTAPLSWIGFENSIRIVERHQRVMIRPLPRSSTDVPKAMVQQRAATWYEAVMKGQAMRAGYPIAEPALVSIGGQPAVRIDTPPAGFQMGVVANFGTPIFGAMWEMHYALQLPPTGQIQIPQNLMYDLLTPKPINAPEIVEPAGGGVLAAAAPGQDQIA